MAMSLSEQTRHRWEQATARGAVECQAVHQPHPGQSSNHDQTQYSLNRGCQQPRQIQLPLHASQRDYHQRMVEHIRNNALDSLKTTSLNLPPTTSTSTSPVDPSYPPTEWQDHSGQYAPTLLPQDTSNNCSTSTSNSTSLPSPSGMYQSNGRRYGPFYESRAGHEPRPQSPSMNDAGGSGLLTQPFDLASAASMDIAPYHSVKAGQQYPPFGGPPAGDIAMPASTDMPQSAFEKMSNDYSHLAFSDTGLGLHTHAPHPSYTSFNDIGVYGMLQAGAFGYANPPLPSAPGVEMLGLPNPSASGIATGHLAGQSAMTGVNPTFLHTSALNSFRTYDNGQSPVDGQVATRPQTAERPDSPLCAVSPGSSILSARIPLPHGRSTSEGFSPRTLPQSGHKRKLTWSPSMAREGPNISQAQKELELVELARLERGGPELKEAKRKLQNRLAQRAFRARSKLVNSAAASHLNDLEALSDLQAEEMRHMESTMAKLQAENVKLRTERQDMLGNASRRRSSRARSPGEGPIK